MLNHQGLFEEQEMMSTQMGFYSFPLNLGSLPFGCNQSSLKTLITASTTTIDAPPTTTLMTQFPTPKLKEDISSSHFGGSHLLSLQRSASNLL